MLISQRQSEPATGQGCPVGNFAELRRHLAHPSSIGDTDRQRLMDLARRLARVRAMGDEYLRVDLSEYAASALCSTAET